MQLEAEILKKINKIYGKFLATQGLPVWGATVKTAQGDYRVLYVDDDGKLVVSASIPGTVDVGDRWARQLGQVDLARYLGSAVGLSNPIHMQTVYGGAVIDPRDIRALDPSVDVARVYCMGNLGADLPQRSTTNDLYVQLRNAGAEIDPRNIRALTASDVVSAQLRGYDSVGAAWQDLYTDSSNRLKTQLDSIPNPPNLDVALSTRMPSSGGTVGLEAGSNDIGYILGSQGQRLLQRATTYDLLIQLRHAGAEIDPRSINREGVQNSFSVSASAAGSTVIYTPSSGKAAQVVGWSFYCDADVVCEMRFSTSGNLIAGLPTKGSHAMNLVGLTPPQGSADETIEIYVSDAANVKGWILIKEV